MKKQRTVIPTPRTYKHPRMKDFEQNNETTTLARKDSQRMNLQDNVESPKKVRREKVERID
jgi:hypothetical protein